MEKIKKSTIVWLGLLFFAAICLGSALGLGLSGTVNVINSEYITTFDTALPTKLLDINGELITEFASDEKREIISLNRLPNHMLAALLTREDRIFYRHNGFSSKALFRAVVGQLTRRSLGGGSTLTQQIAGTLYCDRAEMSITRKLKELWWAIQMERRYSKNEILELYLNRIYFGGGTYGVNAASKYYFGHSAEDITPAEAAILVIQLSNPAFYNPFDHPNRAMERQKDVLNSMVKAGYIAREAADDSFEDFWSGFDYTRTSASAYLMRDDSAPWFSEYVRRELGGMIYGSQNIYT
ncbi:MAG: transglycosylase domain-containing protein, partial [Treponemataceae bacterium]|nr:transglycosylase domain-containing protein [Treponemataceae bacterium]